MAIREDIVASAVDFLRDPSVASSSIESRIAFLQTKNLTPEEVQAALARVGVDASAVSPVASSQSVATRAPAAAPQPFYGQQPQQYPPYGWQQSPPDAPRRDWRDWFIMATVVSGVGYGVYSLTKRYIYPLVAPPTPDRLEADKKAIDEQFDRAFSLVEQLAKDTDALKAAEQQRTERLDTALTELETVITDLKSANRRREDDAQRIRDEVQDLKASIPKALDAQKELANERLKEVNVEVTSLKTLLSQRLSSAIVSNIPTLSSATVSNVPTPPMGMSYIRPSVTPAVAPLSPSPAQVVAASVSNGVSVPPANGDSAEAAQDGPTFRSAFGIGGGSGGARASIPAWQRAMEAKSTPPPNVPVAEAVNGTSA
ncbi:hypothetical protein RB595_002411 [Gaeumannomyces hyphopodioides]